MPKLVSFRQGLLSVLFWSIIAAAFIGPGTVTTSSKSGASFQLELLWALVFSILATMLLQEAAARITIASGKSLGEIIAIKYAGGQNQRIKTSLFLAVAIGCAAYQAGNMLGALSGIALFSNFSQKILTLVLWAICGSLLWIGNYRIIANLLGIVVATMGIAFLYVAFQTDFSALSIAKSAVVPSFPSGSALLIIGLIGTTIVPYNLFLASGISKGQSIREMRLGIGIAVLIGGIISIAIMVVGTQVTGEFSFQTLANAMAAKLGKGATVFFGMGLFAAGLSSSITSPLAAAVTAQSLFGTDDANWSSTSRNFRLVWGSILCIGLFFGLLEIKPIPIIILAQALNGILLPIVTIFLLLAVNDRSLLTPAYTNGKYFNILMLLIVGVTCWLGLNNLWKAFGQVIPLFQFELTTNLVINSVLTIGIISYLGTKIFRD